MINNTTSLDDRAADWRYLICAIAYLGGVLFFSSFFYLATEDYELAVATRLIGEGATIGKSTGWPYTPLVPYLLYPYAALFGENILAFRLLTAGVMLASVFPIYWVLRSFCAPFLSFSLTLFAFSLTTFPHPRLEYYVEAAFLAFAIYFAVKVIRARRSNDVYLCAGFLLAAFASRGFPNLALLVGLMPLALIAVVLLNRYENNSSTQENVSPASKAWKWWVGSLLFFCCAGFLIAFMKKAVHNTLFYELRSLVRPGDFVWLKQVRTLAGPALLALFFIICLLVSWRKNHRLLSKTDDNDTLHIAAGLNATQVLLPLLVCALVFLTIGFVVFPPSDYLFFLFPLDIFLDHTRQLSSGRSYIAPLFISLLALLLFLRVFANRRSYDIHVALFLILLLPSTFARFFPTYNLLYLISFALAVFLCIILPRFAQDYVKRQGAIVPIVQWAAGLFLLVFAVGSNLTLLVATQLSDVFSERLVQMDRGALRRIFVEKDIVAFFSAVNNSITKFAGPDEPVAFFSNRFLKYVPLIYGHNDVLAGQNLIAGLGKLWSYDDLLKRNGIRSESRLNVDGRIYYWRRVALKKIEEHKVRVMIMSLYTPEIVNREIAPSADSFREYLRGNFVIAAVINPTMKIHRRSAFSEGAVILVRK